MILFKKVEELESLLSNTGEMIFHNHYKVLARTPRT